MQTLSWGSWSPLLRKLGSSRCGNGGGGFVFSFLYSMGELWLGAS